MVAVEMRNKNPDIVKVETTGFTVGSDADCERKRIFRMTPRFIWPEQTERWRDHLPRGRRLGKEQEIRSMVSDIYKLEI